MVDLTTLDDLPSPTVDDITYAVDDPASAKNPRKLTLGNIAALFKDIVETLTGKTINLANNTLTGTAAEFDTACSDDNFVYTSDGVVLSGGALGTPSSGTLTNCLGLPQSGVIDLTTDLGNKVTTGGALGTPSSGTLTNCTGLPQSGVINLTTDLSNKAPIASPTFTGTVTLPATDLADNNLDNIKGLINNVETISSAASIAINFATQNLAKITSLAHAPTFTTSNIVEGAKKRILIISDGTPRALTFSESWKWVTAVPTTTAASKNSILSLECLGTASTDVWAAWVEQP